MIERGIKQKTIILSVILLVIGLLLTGCGRKNTFDGSRISNETEFRMEYSILDREESAEMKLTEGDRIQVHISHTAGNVDVIVGENGEEPIYKGTEQENADFILTIPAVPLRDSAIVICAAATFAAIQEGHFIRTGREILGAVYGEARDSAKQSYGAVF